MRTWSDWTDPVRSSFNSDFECLLYFNCPVNIINVGGQNRNNSYLLHKRNKLAFRLECSPGSSGLLRKLFQRIQRILFPTRTPLRGIPHNRSEFPHDQQQVQIYPHNHLRQYHRNYFAGLHLTNLYSIATDNHRVRSSATVFLFDRNRSQSFTTVLLCHD